MTRNKSLIPPSFLLFLCWGDTESLGTATANGATAPAHDTKCKNVEHIAHNKPLMNCRSIEPWPPWFKPATNHLSHITAVILRTVRIISQFRLLSSLQLLSHSLRQQWKSHLVHCSTEFSTLHKIQTQLLIFYESKQAQKMMYDHPVPYCVYAPTTSQSWHEWLDF